VKTDKTTAFARQGGRLLLDSIDISSTLGGLRERPLAANPPWMVPVKLSADANRRKTKS
jgi:hypothetical protein